MSQPRTSESNDIPASAMTDWSSSSLPDLGSPAVVLGDRALCVGREPAPSRGLGECPRLLIDGRRDHEDRAFAIDDLGEPRWPRRHRGPWVREARGRRGCACTAPLRASAPASAEMGASAGLSIGLAGFAALDVGRRATGDAEHEPGVDQQRIGDRHQCRAGQQEQAAVDQCQPRPRPAHIRYPALATVSITPGSPSLARSRLIVTLTAPVNGSAASSHTRASSSSAETTRP